METIKNIVLRRYFDKSYIVQKKANALYHLYYYGIPLILLFVIKNSIITYDYFNLLIDIVLLFVFSACLIILGKGKYKYSAGLNSVIMLLMFSYAFIQKIDTYSKTGQNEWLVWFYPTIIFISFFLSKRYLILSSVYYHNKYLHTFIL